MKSYWSQVSEDKYEYLVFDPVFGTTDLGMVVSENDRWNCIARYGDLDFQRHFNFKDTLEEAKISVERKVKDECFYFRSG